MKLVSKIFILIIIVFTIYIFNNLSVNNSITKTDKSVCNTNDFNINIREYSFINECRVSDCSVMKGTAIITNNCINSAGVEVKIIGYDKNNEIIKVRDIWPASINNIPPGEYPISINQYLEFDKRIESISIEPIRVKIWN